MARSFAVKAVHKQMYPATYNFRDDVDGAFPAGFSDGDGADCNTTVIASLDGHKKVLQFDDQGAATRCKITVTITQGLNTVVEFWATKDSIATNTVFPFYIKEDATVLLRLRFDNNDLDYYPGVLTSIKDDFLIANKLSHFKAVLNDTANTFDIYINGILEGSGLAYENNSTSGANNIVIETDNADTGYKCYIDAIGVSTDANYNVGDNCFWRHYKESTDSLEEDDVGKQGSSITWVDAIDTAASVEIVTEFNEHKKILRQYYSSGVGGYDYSRHNFAAAGKNGWFAKWIKVDDVTVDNYVLLIDSSATSIIYLGIGNSVFEYQANGGAWTTVPSSPTPANGTWYFIYIQWYDDVNDNFDLWINNVLYLDGVQTLNNQDATGMFAVDVRGFSATKYIYIDAPISSLDGDEKGDNRTFDYNDSYTREDITTDIINVITKNTLGKWREGDLYTKKDYENSEIFVQIYDINSKLSMEAELKKRDQISDVRKYPLRDKNEDDLKNERTHAFSAAKIHDPTDSTCMLKTILPNVSEADGDLILVDADTKTDTYSPTIKNYPDYKMLIDIMDLADSILIVQADGKCYLDDDKASGTTLDFDIETDKDNMTATPLVTDILETINYFVIKGKINPETGERLVKVIDNVGTDKKKSWRYTNNSFLTQTDVDNYAAKLVARAIKVKIIKFTAQSLGAHNMGETINYKFVNALYNIPQANYYVKYEEIDYDANENTIILSEGMIEESKYAAEYELPEEYNNAYASEIYDTDLIVFIIPVWTLLGSTQAQWYVQADNTEAVIINFSTEENLDVGREIVIKVPFQRKDAGADTVDIELYLDYWKHDGSAKVFEWAAVADTLPATAINKFNVKKITIPANTLPAESTVDFYIVINEAGKTIAFYPMIYRYYQKRSVE